MRVLYVGLSVGVLYIFQLRSQRKNSSSCALVLCGLAWDRRRRCTGSPERGSGEPASHSPGLRSGLSSAFSLASGETRRDLPRSQLGTQVSSRNHPDHLPEPDSTPRPQGAVGEEKRKESRKAPPEGGSSAGLRPFLPLPTASPAAALL